MISANDRAKAFDLIAKRVLALLALLATLTLIPGTAQAQTNAECYNPAYAQTIGQAGWTGCEGMYI
jgi:hypothetical protein